jgi:hypothetical protein
MEKMIFRTVPRPHASAILIWVGDIAGLSLLLACLLLGSHVSNSSAVTPGAASSRLLICGILELALWRVKMHIINIW